MATSDAQVPPKLLALLTSVTTLHNPFDVLGVLPEDSNHDIQKKYRKLSLQCHPDRCHHPLADTAISCLSKAMKAIEDEEQRKKFTDIIENARIVLVTELKTKGMVDKIDAASPEYREMLAQRSEKIYLDMEEKLQRAEKMRQANIKREREEMQHQEELRKMREEEEQAWERGRQQRVTDWRNFMKRKAPKEENEHRPIKPPKRTVMN